MLRLGDLVHRLVIESPTDTGEAGAGFTRTWTRTGVVWAQIENSSAGEEFFANAVDGRTTHIVRCQYHSLVTLKSRLLLDAPGQTVRELYVVGIEIQGEVKREMVVRCEERAK